MKSLMITKHAAALLGVFMLFLVKWTNQVELPPFFTSQVVSGYNGTYPAQYIGLLATETQFPYLSDLHVVKSITTGNHDDVFFSDTKSIYKIDTSNGLLSLIAFQVSSHIERIHAVPALDTVFFFDDQEYVIKKVNYKTGQTEIVAGIKGVITETPDQLATNTSLGYYVGSMFYTKKGELYFANGSYAKVKKINLLGNIETIVGNSYIPDTTQENNDAFNLPQKATGKLSHLGLVNSIYVTEGVYGEELLYLGNSAQIHLVNMSSGVKTIIAGSMTQSSTSVPDGSTARGGNTNGGAGIQSLVVEHNSLDPFNKVYYYPDSDNQAIRKVVKGKIYAHVRGVEDQSTSFANKTRSFVRHLSISPLTNEIYYVDAQYHTIRKVNNNGVVTTIAGTYDNFTPQRMKINPMDLSLNSRNEVIVLDKLSNRILRLSNSTNRFVTLQYGYSYDGVGQINAVHVHSIDNSIYFSTSTQVFKLFENGSRVIIAGNGECTLPIPDEESEALATAICNVYSMLVEEDGSVLISLYGNRRIMRILPNGMMSTVVGNSSIVGFPISKDGLTGPQTPINHPMKISKLHTTGELVFIEYATPRIRKVQRDGTIITLIGNGTRGYNGDFGQGRDLLLNSPYSLFITKDDFIYVADSGNNRIIKYDSKSGYARTIIKGDIVKPLSIVVNSKNELFVSDYGNSVIRKFTPSCSDGYTYSPVSDSCVDLTCYGKSAQDLNVCSSKGNCIDVDVCQCYTGYTGKECSQSVPNPSRSSSSSTPTTPHPSTRLNDSASNVINLINLALVLTVAWLLVSFT